MTRSSHEVTWRKEVCIWRDSKNPRFSVHVNLLWTFRDGLLFCLYIYVPTGIGLILPHVASIHFHRARHLRAPGPTPLTFPGTAAPGGDGGVPVSRCPLEAWRGHRHRERPQPGRKLWETISLPSRRKNVCGWGSAPLPMGLKGELWEEKEPKDWNIYFKKKRKSGINFAIHRKETITEKAKKRKTKRRFLQL